MRESGRLEGGCQKSSAAFIKTFRYNIPNFNFIVNVVFDRLYAAVTRKVECIEKALKAPHSRAVKGKHAVAT